jgi:hypothetical protein
MCAKVTYKMLVKLAKGINFTNIYKQLFHIKVYCKAFMDLQFVFEIFKQKEIGSKVVV